ncbi:MAG: hypothetical protein ABW140_10760 [Candidatus Sedimenticola sp. 6PFRAG1]
MSEEFLELFHQYTARFGHTFISFDLGPEHRELAMKLMQDSLDGKRGPVRDKDLGFDDLPPDVDI